MMTMPHRGIVIMRWMSMACLDTARVACMGKARGPGWRAWARALCSRSPSQSMHKPMRSSYDVIQSRQDDNVIVFKTQRCRAGQSMEECLVQLGKNNLRGKGGEEWG